MIILQAIGFAEILILLVVLVVLIAVGFWIFINILRGYNEGIGYSEAGDEE